jgi:hypothetical protein
LQVRLFQSTTTASIDAFYYTETIHSFTTCPTGLNYFNAICLALFESNTASNEGLSLQVRFFQSPAASIKAFCYKAMLHVLKEIPHHSPQSIQKCQFPGTYILCLNMSNLDRNVYVRIQDSKISRFHDLHRSC